MNRNTTRRAAVLLAIALATSAASAEWVVTEVPLLPSWTGGVELQGINDHGEACGMGNYVINTSSTVFRFDGTTVTELPHLLPSDPITLATAINNNGVICGYSHNALGNSQTVYWVGTTLYTIPYPPDANTSSDFRAYDINDVGVIVGYFWNTSSERTAFYYHDGVTYSLDTAIRNAGLFGMQAANAVNDAGVICGGADDAFGADTAWTYDIDSGTLTVLGKIGTDNCSVQDINLAGQTIGRAKQSSLDPYYRAVTYTGTWQFVDTTVPVVQWGIALNDAGRMIGNASSSANRWSWYSDGPGDGSIIQLDLPDFTRETFAGINNHDWIVGYGWTPTSGGEERGFIIAPPPGDYDHDGYLRASDYLALETCMSGPYADAGFTPPSDACLRTFDAAPADNDVDLADFLAFQLAFEGS